MVVFTLLKIPYNKIYRDRDTVEFKRILSHKIICKDIKMKSRDTSPGLTVTHGV